MSSRRHLTLLLGGLVLATFACDDPAPVVLGRRVPAHEGDAGEQADASVRDAGMSQREHEEEENEAEEHERDEEL